MEVLPFDRGWNTLEAEHEKQVLYCKLNYFGANPYKHFFFTVSAFSFHMKDIFIMPQAIKPVIKKQQIEEENNFII